MIKQRAKQAVRRAVGEPYVGKRMKMRSLNRELDALTLDPTAILDAGAEDATFVYWLADRFPLATVTAVDIDAGAIAACLAARPTSYAQRVQFEVGTFDGLPPESFDLVSAFDVLEHIPDDKGAAVALYRALRPGGMLLVHVPRDRWVTRSGVVHAFADEDAWQINSGHVRQGYSPNSLYALVAGAGFDVVDVQTWTRRWGVLAHEVYERLEHPAPLRALSIPVTDVCSRLDRRRPADEGNTVYLLARKPV